MPEGGNNCPLCGRESVHTDAYGDSACYLCDTEVKYNTRTGEFEVKA